MADPLFDSLLAIYAYDSGSTDSGIHDEVLRRRLIEEIDAYPKSQLDPGLRLQLSRYVRDEMLSEDDLQQGYGWEDVLAFLRWIDSGDFRG